MSGNEHDDLKTQIAGLSVKIDRVLDAINGNGTPGFKTRLALVEARLGLIARVTWLLVGAFATAVAKWVLDLFGRGGGT